MYPLQYLFSRTTGYLKNLLEEIKKKLTKFGVKNMLEVYYAPDKITSLKFKNFLINKIFTFFK